MSLIRVLVADDEPLALERIAGLFGELPEVELVGAVGSGQEAIASVAKLRPDLVVLDIEMPKIDGFDVVEAISRSAPLRQQPPLFAFVTAYPQFAVQAFDTGALDYLCKPVRLSRLEKMLERARASLERRDAAERLDELNGRLSDLREATGCVDEHTFWIRHRGELIRITIDDVHWIKAEGQYARLHLADRSFLLRNSISALAEQLASTGFLQIHRSAIVNRRMISTLKSGRYGMKLELISGTQLTVGRKFRPAMREFIN